MDLPLETQSHNVFILPTFPLYQVFKKNYCRFCWISLFQCNMHLKQKRNISSFLCFVCSLNCDYSAHAFNFFHFPFFNWYCWWSFLWVIVEDMMHRVFFPPFDIDCQSQLLHGLIIPLGDLLCFCCLVLFFFSH